MPGAIVLVLAGGVGGGKRHRLEGVHVVLCRCSVRRGRCVPCSRRCVDAVHGQHTGDGDDEEDPRDPVHHADRIGALVR
jgi:hypothetical protein